MPTLKPVADFFSNWSIPKPLRKENHVVPCYESLIGAGYALCKAEEKGYAESSLEEYDVSSLAGCLPLIAACRKPEGKNWKIWECGFYFLSALHRIVWVHERLLKIFACLPLAEDSDAHLNAESKIKIRFEELAKKAWERIGKFEAFSGVHALDGIKNALHACNRGSNKEISNSNCLSALRNRGNLQKHAIEGVTFLGPESSVPKENILAFKWELLSCEKKLDFALTAFDLVSSLYIDVHCLYFEDKIFRT